MHTLFGNTELFAATRSDTNHQPVTPAACLFSELVILRRFHRTLVATIVVVLCQVLVSGHVLSANVTGKIESSDARLEAVFLAQSHVMRPGQPYFKLTGNRDALLKAQVVSPSGAAAPEVMALVINGGETNTLKLKGPAVLSKSFAAEPGVVQHRFDDSFTALIPARLVRKGMIIEVRAGTSVVRHEIAVGAPTVVQMKMFDVHYFGRGKEDYPANFLKELESKWPVAALEIERVRGINFPELVIPARDKIPATRVEKPEDYQKKTGAKFDGEQAAALQWVWALSRAGGNRDVAMCYINILGVNAGGQAGGFNGVGTIRLGIMNHELGHALGLPHIGEQKDYPYRGEMFGIKPPKVFNEVHALPPQGMDKEQTKT